MTETIELREYIRPLLRRWWLIVGCTILAGLAGAIYSIWQPALYESVTTMMVGAALLEPNPESNELNLANQLAHAYADMANRTTIREATRESLGLEELPQYTARVIPDSQIIEINVVDESPEMAQSVAIELAAQLIEATPSSKYDQGRQEFINAQIQALETGILDTNNEIERIEQELPQMFSARQIADAKAQISALDSKVSTLQANYAALLANTHRGATNTISVLEPADLPKGRMNNDLAINILVAALVGFALSAAGAFALDYLDDTLHDEDDAARYLQLPALGSIPEANGKGANASRLTIPGDQHTTVTDAYAALRLSIQAAALPNPFPKLLVISSSMAGEGKSLTAANLSIELARAGSKVILVDADLYKPVQHRLFNLDNRRGMTTHLLDSNIHLSDLLYRTEIQELLVLTSGPLVSNALSLLSREIRQGILAELQEIADIVVIDTPPTTAAAAASILAVNADGVLLALPADRTKRSLTQRAVKSLRQIHAPLLGVILYDTPLKQSLYRSSNGYQPTLDDPRDMNRQGKPVRLSGNALGRPAPPSQANGDIRTEIPIPRQE